MSESLTHQRFAACLHQMFATTLEDAALELELLQVDVQPSTASMSGMPGGREPFSLVFRGPPEPVLRQGLYAFQREPLGEINLFIVPIGPDEQGMRYEAVFN